MHKDHLCSSGFRVDTTKVTFKALDLSSQYQWSMMVILDVYGFVPSTLQPTATDCMFDLNHVDSFFGSQQLISRRLAHHSQGRRASSSGMSGPVVHVVATW